MPSISMITPSSLVTETETETKTRRPKFPTLQYIDDQAKAVKIASRHHLETKTVTAMLQDKDLTAPIGLRVVCGQHNLPARPVNYKSVAYCILLPVIALVPYRLDTVLN